MITKASSSTSKPFSFSLKALLLAVAAFGIFLTPFHWFGLAYLISASLTAGLVVACILSQRSASPWLALAPAVIGAIVGFPLAIMGAAIYFIHAVLNATLCFLLLLLSVRPKLFAICTASLAIGFYGYVIWEGAAGGRDLLALREQYPLVSLRDRLVFERAEQANVKIELVALSPTIAANLDEQDDEFSDGRYFSRSGALRELHENMSRQFAYAAGFGVSRMSNIVSPERVRLTPRQRIILPLVMAVPLGLPTGINFSMLHQRAVRDFLNAERMGYARSGDEVAGFDAHGFSSRAEAFGYDEDASKWNVTRLELVGLLRHDEPQVYVANTLPFMDESADIPRRPLNEFETQALPQLRASEDIVVDRQPEHIYMLGAIRASTSCLTCHNGERGKLLGAFSYSIEPDVGDEAKTSKSVEDTAAES